MKAKCWVVETAFQGMPKLSDMVIKEEELGPIKDGEFLCAAEILSIDPYLRVFGNVAGNVMIGDQIAKVIESKNKSFPVGSLISINSGMRTHSVSDGSNARLLPDLEGLPTSLGLGVMGMAGLTAYIGLHEILEAKKGQVIYVNGAAGAVGSVVGQLAKIQGCKVIGSASTPQKMAYLQEIGYDRVFNYKEKDLDTALKEAAPEGIDLFFDNVGGPGALTVIKNMNQRGRLAICGGITGYNDPGEAGSKAVGPLPFFDMLKKEIRAEGFLYWSWAKKYPEYEKVIRGLLKQGKIKYREYPLYGFDKMPAGLVEMLKGTYIGKMLVFVKGNQSQIVESDKL